jgi:oligopeptide transport system substrate-binding protein
MFHSLDGIATPDAGDAAVAAAKANLGVRALDDRTLEVRLEHPAPYLPQIAASWAFFPLRQDLIDAGGPEWWANPATRVGNGPFRLVDYGATKPNQRLTFARNDRYWGGHAKLDRITFLFDDYNDPATLQAYRDGKYDMNWTPYDDLPAVEADPALSRDLVLLPVPGTIYFNFNITREPFQDQKVREAFAYAFDREAYCRELLFGVCRPTLSLIPPGMPGAIETDAYAFDPAKARQALAASTYGSPERLPQITWYGIADDPGSEREAQWFYQQFRQVLGIELKLVYTSGDEHDALYDAPATVPQFHESTWYGDPDPRDWFLNWRCNTTRNKEGYCNPALDAMLDQADSELDPEQRIALYEDAGRMLVADQPAIFAYTAVNPVLVKPYVVGYSRTTPDGNWPGSTNLLAIDIERPG